MIVYAHYMPMLCGESVASHLDNAIVAIAQADKAGINTPGMCPATRARMDALSAP